MRIIVYKDGDAVRLREERVQARRLHENGPRQVEVHILTNFVRWLDGKSDGGDAAQTAKEHRLKRIAAAVICGKVVLGAVACNALCAARVNVLARDECRCEVAILNTRAMCRRAIAPTTDMAGDARLCNAYPAACNTAASSAYVFCQYVAVCLRASILIGRPLRAVRPK